jgi:two-component system, sensor histidine kinase LadS
MLTKKLFTDRVAFLVLAMLSLLMLSMTAHADYSIILQNNQKEYSISSQFVEQLEDSLANYTIEQVSSSAFLNKFKASGETMLRNTNREAAYWLRFKIINKTDKSQQWLVESFNFRINEITFFLKTKVGFVEVVQGDTYPFKQRSVGHKNFDFLLPNSADTLICYFRIRTKQPASFELVVRRFDTFTSYAVGEYFLLGIFYGTIGIVALFSLFLSLAFRRTVFLYYSFFLFGFGVFFMCQDGTGFQYLWSDLPIINAHSISIARILLLIPYTLYFMEFLDVRKKIPIIWKCMIGWIVCRIVLLFIGEENDFLFSLILYYDYIPFIVAYFSAIYTYKNGFKPALYFALGFSVLLISFAINSLRVACIVESTIFTAYSLNFGAVIDILLLSLGLGSWLQQIIQEKTVTESMNRLLEEKVNERTEVLQMQNSIINEKIEELDTLFYRLSHDIKGPIKSILGLVNLGAIDSQDQQEYFRRIQLSAKNLDKITSDFVQLSHVQKYKGDKISEIDFTQLVEQIIQSLRYIPEFKNISIRININQQNVFYSHKHILHSVILNIIENAIKYRDPNDLESKLDILIVVDNDRAVLKFIDNGVRIAKGNEENVFNIFFREGVKEGVVGSGLGLYIVKMSLQKINGSITYMPSENKGSTFVVEVPNVI